MGRIVIGTCGFQRARRLHYQNLDGVEVQQTFYDPRSIETFTRWRREAPEDFIFTMKAWMLVTHKYNRKLWSRLKGEVPGDKEEYGFLKDNPRIWWAWEKTLEAAEALEAAVIVLQSPASFKPTKENLDRLNTFLDKAPRRGRRLAWEPRGEWWARPGLLEDIANNHDILIVGDPLKDRTPLGAEWYMRLHGMGGEVNYKYKYTGEELERLSTILAGNRGNAGSIYVMFNNVYAYEDALTLKRLLAQRL